MIKMKKSMGLFDKPTNDTQFGKTTESIKKQVFFQLVVYVAP